MPYSECMVVQFVGVGIPYGALIEVSSKQPAFESVEDMFSDMGIYRLKCTKDLKRLSAAEQKQTANKLKLLMQNPFYPSLRTKRDRDLTMCLK